MQLELHNFAIKYDNHKNSNSPSQRDFPIGYMANVLGHMTW